MKACLSRSAIPNAERVPAHLDEETAPDFFFTHLFLSAVLPPFFAPYTDSHPLDLGTAFKTSTSPPIPADMALSLFEHGQDASTRPGSRILLGLSPSADRAELEKLLFSWGYLVTVTEDATTLGERLQQAEAAPILIVDTALRGLDGVALTHQLQLRSSRRRSWTIALIDPAAASRAPARSSGQRSAAGSRLLAECTAIDDVLLKPLDAFELRVCLRAAHRIQALHAEMVDSIDSARFHADHDALTGLWNRQALLARIFQETDRTRRIGVPLAFLAVDLDRFGLVNRDHGYDGGDNVLRQLASRFRRYLRSYDLTGRWGEDEFLIAMPGASNDDARAMADRLRASIVERPFDILKASVSLTASLGVAQSHGRSPLVVLREAASALVKAKQAGGDCLRFFSPGEVLPLVSRYWSTGETATTETATRSLHA